MAAVVGAEAFKTGMETGLIPNSHVAPGTPPQPHSTANVAAKPSNCAALGMARARPIAFLRHLDNVAAHTCRRRSRRRLREDGRVQCHPQRPSSLLSFNYVASWVARARRRRRQRRGRPYSGCFGTSYPHRGKPVCTHNEANYEKSAEEGQFGTRRLSLLHCGQRAN